MKCEDCCHAEMCRWIDELEGRGCDFGEPCEDAISREAANKKEINDVLEQIRDEIAVLDDADYDYEGYYKAVTDAVKIIDKHISRKE